MPGSPPQPLQRRFEAAVFDWDGTAVADRRADAIRLREVVESLCARGFHVGVVTGTHVANVDGQLRARPRGPGRLYLLVNRGSEVFRVDEAGVALLHRRIASTSEDAALTSAAARTAAQLAARGLVIGGVVERCNRRKVDLIPDPAWVDPPKARIAELVMAVEERLRQSGLPRGLLDVVEIATAAARQAGLADPRVTTDGKHVEIGLTDKSDSSRWILHELWALGIGPELLLLAGDEWGTLGGARGSDSFLLAPGTEPATAVSVGVEPTGVPSPVIRLGGGPETLVRLLEDQLERRARREVPRVDRTPSFFLEVDGLDPELERVHEVELTLADGRIGTSGSPLEDHAAARPRVLAAGLYDGEGPRTTLALCPTWHRLHMAGSRPEGAGEWRRVLDMHAGLLRHERRIGPDSEAILFASLARPGVTALRWAGPRGDLAPGAPLAVPPGAVPPLDLGDDDGRMWIRCATSTGEIVASAVESHRTGEDGVATLERLAAYVVRPSGTPPQDDAIRRVRNAERAGFETVLAEHRQAWGSRWEAADVAIEGDPAMQLAVRFALFHLMASVADADEAAVGARGLSGSAYLGHVFWDADVFVLPFLAATHPPSARAMLEYRLRRLPAARALARATGRSGARFPWESAASGADVTPTSALDRRGETVAIRTGECEEHIVADVAWAAAFYVDWTGDRAFAEGPGRELLIETARYWMSRIRVDASLRGHIDGVIGPDEYHEGVDDNAFTNVMARWNLRRAADLEVGADVSAEERRGWRDMAACIVDGYDAQTGLYEQFAGFHRLEPLLVAELAPDRPIAADFLLGHERVQASQILKQADVLMLHHMLPGEVEPGSLLPNLLHYEPRTAHGSSLSPGIHASLFARAGRLDAALPLLRIASRIDLDDLTGTTAGGLHLAAMGSVWQALAFGFLGLRPQGDVLALDPHLPAAWSALAVRILYRGRRVRIRVEKETATVTADPALAVRVRDLAPVDVSSAGRTFTRRAAGWEVP